MDFKLVLSKLLTAFHEHNTRYALMGGFAIGLWGGSRSTVDLDFIVHRDDMDIVHNIMLGLGYDRLHYTENVSQYASPLRLFGGIDFIHAFRDASVDMLQRAVLKDIFGGSLKIRTLIPEDIIGMKLQAIYNNPSRRDADTEDVTMLISLHRGNLDEELMKKYFELFHMEDLYEKMVKEDTE